MSEFAAKPLIWLSHRFHPTAICNPIRGLKLPPQISLPAFSVFHRCFSVFSVARNSAGSRQQDVPPLLRSGGSAERLCGSKRKPFWRSSTPPYNHLLSHPCLIRAFQWLEICRHARKFPASELLFFWGGCFAGFARELGGD